MRTYLTFLNKELLESRRSYRFLIMVLAFIIIGIMNPLIAKLTPTLLENFMPEGMNIVIPIPTAMDSWAQFFSNTNQIGILVVLILFSGILSKEISKGTLINMVTKGLPRVTIILAKFSYLFITWTVCFLVNFFITYIYTIFLFEGTELPALAFSVFSLWLFGILLLAIILFAATLVKSSYGTLLITGGFIIAGFLVAIAPGAYRFNPLSLASQNLAMLGDVHPIQDFYPLIGITIGLIFIFLIVAMVIFRKKQL